MLNYSTSLKKILPSGIQTGRPLHLKAIALTSMAPGSPDVRLTIEDLTVYFSASHDRFNKTRINSGCSSCHFGTCYEW
jgi:hypothetical protein